MVEKTKDRQCSFLEVNTSVYLLEETARAFRDWDTGPGGFAFALVDLTAARGDHRNTPTNTAADHHRGYRLSPSTEKVMWFPLTESLGQELNKVAEP